MKHKHTIAITGASGLVGSRIHDLLADQYVIKALNSSDFDITNVDQVSEWVTAIKPTFIIHCAGYTNVDGAESDFETARRINATGTHNIVKASISSKTRIIYISSDFVFDGTQPPYTEASIPRPISAYGKSKHEGEQALKNNHMIIRIAYPFRAAFEPKKDFVRSLRDLLVQGKNLTMVTDSIMTPTFIDDIALQMPYLIASYSPRTVHITGTEPISPYHAAQAIAKRWNLNEALIAPTTYKQFFTNKAQRPQYSLMLTTDKTIRSSMHSFSDSLQLCPD